MRNGVVASNSYRIFRHPFLECIARARRIEPDHLRIRVFLLEILFRNHVTDEPKLRILGGWHLRVGVRVHRELIADTTNDDVLVEAIRRLVFGLHHPITIATGSGLLEGSVIGDIRSTLALDRSYKARIHLCGFDIDLIADRAYVDGWPVLSLRIRNLMHKCLELVKGKAGTFIGVALR